MIMTMEYSRFFQFLLYSCLLFITCLGSLEQAGTQFITYNGTISGRFEHPVSAPFKCSTYYFDSLDNSFVRVGTNPPWDTNPFYFSVGHAGKRVRAHNSSCFSPGGCTLDPIHNLMFRTTDYLCYTNEGKQCGAVEFRYHFVPAEMINLNESTIKQIDWKTDKGYSVVGNQRSFQNGSTPNAFDFQIPSNYTSHRGCAEELDFEWNSTTHFTYAVNFTNTSAEAEFSLGSTRGTVLFRFSGKRLDRAGEPEDSKFDPYNDGAYIPISLNTSNPSMPGFNFINGSDFHWRNSSRGIWHATPPKSSAVSLFDAHFRVLNCMSVTMVAGILFL